MIQPEEIRLGNWVLHNKVPVKVMVSNAVRLYQSKDKCDHILLTPRILEKAGAIRRHGNEWFLGKLKFDLNSTGKIIRFHYSGKVAYIDHVHTLQNLVYALTGTELTIEL
jgi:hypothetical protein